MGNPALRCQSQLARHRSESLSSFPRLPTPKPQSLTLSGCAYTVISAAQAAVQDYPGIRARFEADVAAIDRKIAALEARQSVLLKN